MGETVEAIALGEACERAVELEFVLVKELVEPGGELVAEDAAENVDGQEETWRGGRSEPERSLVRPPAGTMQWI